MNENNQDEYEIDLLQIASLLVKRWWAILISAVVCAGVVFGYTYFFVTPQYETSVMLYINNSSFSVGSTKLNLSTGDIAASQELVKTYGVILSSNLTLQDIEESLSRNANVKNEYTYKDLSEMIKSEAANNTEIMKITVTCSDPEDAVYIADTIAEVLPKRIARIVDGTSVSVVDLAEFPTIASSPSYTKNTAIGFAVGFVLAVAYIFVYNIFIYDAIDNEDWVRETFGEDLPILAVVPDIGTKHGSYYGKYKSYYTSTGATPPEEGEKKISGKFGSRLDFASSEAYNMLRASLEFTCLKEAGIGKVVGITSACPQEGKSITSINLAYTLAKKGSKVVLVDGDLRRPTIGKNLGLAKNVGLSNYIAEGKTPTVYTGVLDPNLNVITSGDIPPNPAEIITSDKMKNLLVTLSKQYDYVIVDLPPVNAVSDAFAISTSLDGIIMIARHTITRRSDLIDAVRQLEFAQANLLGVVYNGYFQGGTYYSRKSGYKYYKRYGYKNKYYQKGSYNQYYGYGKGYGYGYGYGYGENNGRRDSNR